MAVFCGFLSSVLCCGSRELVGATPACLLPSSPTPDTPFLDLPDAARARMMSVCIPQVCLSARGNSGHSRMHKPHEFGKRRPARRGGARRCGVTDVFFPAVLLLRLVFGTTVSSSSRSSGATARGTLSCGRACCTSSSNRTATSKDRYLSFRFFTHTAPLRRSPRGSRPSPQQTASRSLRMDGLELLQPCAGISRTFFPPALRGPSTVHHISNSTPSSVGLAAQNSSTARILSRLFYCLHHPPSARSAAQPSPQPADSDLPNPRRPTASSRRCRNSWTCHICKG